MKTGRGYRQYVAPSSLLSALIDLRMKDVLEESLPITESPELHVVTGAFGYTGRYITLRLLSMKKRVRTLTGHPNRENPFGEQVSAFPFNFDNAAVLANSLRGATTLYNTYWVRFQHGNVTYDKAVENTKTLIRAAEEADVRRFVHISITNPSQDSPLPYFRGKALVEEAILRSKLSYAIIRPTLIFGSFGVEGVLINNIAWLLRKFPLFTIAGRGDYKVQPVYVEDVAELAVSLAQQDRNIVIDAVGPEIYTFDQFVHTIAAKVHSKAKIIHVDRWVVLAIAKILGQLLRDIVLTSDEIKGLMAGLLISSMRPNGKMRFSEWLELNADTVGTRYSSELSQHY